MEIFEPYGFIYITTNMINGKRYIGQRKFSNSWQRYLGSGSSLKSAIKKYGRENFKREIVDFAYNKEELNLKEILLIKELDAVGSENYYNILKGGYNSEISYNNKIIRNKNISKALTGRICPKGADNKSAKSVICLNTLTIFGSMIDASKYYNISNKIISANCTGKRRYIGINNEVFIFEFLNEDILKMNEDSLNLYAVNRINEAIKFKNNYNKKENHINARRIICLNTCEIFDCMTLASEKYNVSNKNISSVCIGKRNYAGRINEQFLLWEFYDGEICKLSQNELLYYCKNKTVTEIKRINGNSKGKNHHSARKVMCVNTGEIFNTIIEASERYNIHKTSVSNVLYGKSKTGGVDELGNKLYWKYADIGENL